MLAHLCAWWLRPESLLAGKLCVCLLRAAWPSCARIARFPGGRPFTSYPGKSAGISCFRQLQGSTQPQGRGTRPHCSAGVPGNGDRFLLQEPLLLSHGLCSDAVPGSRVCGWALPRARGHGLLLAPFDLGSCISPVLPSLPRGQADLVPANICCAGSISDVPSQGTQPALHGLG